MTTKAKKSKTQREAEKFPRKAVPNVKGETERETGRNYAALLTSPALAAFRVINGVELKSGLSEQIDVPTMLAELRDQAAAVNDGNLRQAEAMLMNQATALQSLFSRLADRGMGCDTAVTFECNMRMALRAQAQCRATLETLAAIKNPPVLFAKQANVTTGPQQINNSVATPSRTRENESLQNELLEAHHEQRLDTRAEGAAGGTHPVLETVGTGDRPEDRGR